MNTERSYSDQPEDAPASGEAMSAAERLQVSIAADLEEVRTIGMRFVRRLDARADTPEGEEMLPELNTAMVKAARAVRLTAILQLELAGLRQPKGTRAPAGAPANQNAETHWASAGPRPSEKPWEQGDFEHYDDYTAAEQYSAAEAGFNACVDQLEVALIEDYRATGRDDVDEYSAKSLCKIIPCIPHPATDECMKTIDPEMLKLFFGDDLLPPMLGPGQPGVLEQWDEDRERYGGGRNDSS